MKNNLILNLIIGLLIFYEINALPTPKNKTKIRRNYEENPNLFQGDMILPPRSRGVLERGSDIAWPGGVVPYIFGSGHSSSTQQFIVTTMRQMENLLAVNNVKCIQFRPRTTSDSLYITIRNYDGCYSYVGRGSWSGERTVSLADPGCISTGTIMHEFLHALGFHHEQSRPDRDSHVRINYGNIQTGQESNFGKYSDAAVDTQGTPYDYASVMHYSKYAFSKNNLPTIEPLQSGATIGQRNTLSAIDIQEIRKFYKCSTTGGTVNWNGNYWAPACDFQGNDLANVLSRGEDCSTRCAERVGCTHYTWTTYNGGTCYMKQGTVSKSNAIATSDQTMVCGLLPPSSIINWNGNNWALQCLFRGNDLSSAQIRGEDCSSRCAATSGCTHYTWTSYNGGTCYMKRGTVTKSNAIPTSDSTMVCGLL